YQAAIATAGISAGDKTLLETSLHSLSPRFKAKPEPSEYFRIAKDYKSVREFSKAREYLEKIIADKRRPMDERFRAHKELFFVRKLQKNQNFKAYVGQAKRWADFIRTADLKQTSLRPLYYE